MQFECGCIPISTLSDSGSFRYCINFSAKKVTSLLQVRGCTYTNLIPEAFSSMIFKTVDCREKQQIGEENALGMRLASTCTYDFASYVFSDTTQLLTNSSTVFSTLSLPAWQLIIWSKLHRMLNSGVSIDQRTVVSNPSFLHRASPLMPSFGNVSLPPF